MGQQVYEQELVSRAPDALGEGWRVDELVVRSLRSDLPGTRRLPVGLLERSNGAVRRAVGRWTYPSRSIVHRMSLTLPPAPREIITLHDVVAWRFADEGAPVATAGDELRRAAVVACVSTATAADAVDMFGLDNTRVVYAGVDDRFRVAEPLDAASRARLGIRGRYVLHAGGATERKNLAALAGAWQTISRDHPDVTLVLSGPPHPRRTQLFAGLARTNLLGRIDQELIPGLMAGAEAVVVPSLHEGFGLPVLEAMATGAPVVAAATSSLPEVAGDAAVLVAPTAEGVAEGLDAVLSGQVDRAALADAGRARAAEFTWERTAAGYADIWREVGSP